MMSQGIHSLSQSGLGLKNTFYIPINNNLPPQKSQQFSVGYYTAKQGNYNFSVELYHKEMSNLVELKEDALISDIHKTWYEKAEGNGIGKSRGLEIFGNKQFNKFAIGISYSLSKTTRQFSEINNGFEYLYDYDRTHELTIFTKGQINKKWAYNIAWYYMTGNPFTLSTQQTEFPLIFMEPNLWNMGSTSIASSKNNIRMADYHRLDINLERKITKTKKRTTDRVFNFGLYNAYNRSNPYFYYWRSTNGTLFLGSESYFPLIPYINYSIEF